jgi:hypothetical protein
MADATVKVAIVGDNSSLQSALDQSQSKLGSFGRAVGKIALAAGVAAAGGLALLGKASIDAASAAQQSLGGTQAVFGKFADQVIRDGRRAADAFGLSGNQYRESANIIGSLLLNQGEQQDKLRDSTLGLIGTASDLAATYGGETKDAVDALASAFKGEFDPLQNFGITLLQSKVNLEAMRLAGVKTTADFGKLSSATQTAYKRQATLSLISKQGAIAQGQFAKQSQTLAEQQQILGAQWDNLKARIGKALLPVVSALFARLNDDLMPTLRRLAKQYLPEVQAALENMVSGDPSAKLGEIGDSLGDIDWQSMGQSVGDLADTLHELGPALAGVSVESVNSSLKVFSTLIGFAADHLTLLRKVLPLIIAGYIGLKAAQTLNNIAGRDSLIGLGLQLVATRRLIVANRELAVVIREVNGAQGVAAGVTATTSGTLATAEKSTSKLAAAAKGAAGIAGIGALTVGMQQTDSATGALLTTLGGAATGFAVGGPIGAGIGGLAGLMYTLVVNTKDAGAAAQDSYREIAAIDPVEQAKKSLGDLKDTLDQVTGAYTGATRAAALRKLGDAGLIETADKYGISQRTLINAALGQADALRQINPLIADYQGQVKAADDAQARLAEDANNFTDTGFTKAAGEQYDALELQKKAAQGSIAELEKMPGVLKDAGREIRATSAATADYSGKLKGIPPQVKTVIQEEGIEPTARAIADLTRKYELTPKQVKTLIAATGADTSARQVQTLIDRMNALHDEDVYVTTHLITVHGSNKPALGPQGEQTQRAAPKPQEQRQQSDKMALYGERLGDAFGKGAAKGASKHSAALAQSLFGPIGKGAQLTADEIRDALGKATDYVRQIVDKRVKDDKQAAKRSKAILDDLSKRYRLLRANAKAQQQNNDALTHAVDVAQKFHDYANSIRDTFVSFGDITQLGRSDTGKVSLTKLLAELRKRAADAAEFQRLVAQLAAQGLSQTTIEQLTAQGPEAALATVRAIVSGGQTAVDQIAELERQIAASGGALGQTLADKFDVGGNQLGTVAADALVTQLQAHQKDLNDTARRMAAALAAAVKAELAEVKPTKAKGAKQPSGEAVKGGEKQRVTVTLTSQQVSQLERGRQIQLDLDAYRSAGGRARA